MNGHQVEKKYRPKKGADKFYVLLKSDSWTARSKAMIGNQWYGDFAPLDTLWFKNDDLVYVSKSGWLNAPGHDSNLVIEEVEKADVTPELVETKMGYVSKPRQIGDQWWYLAKIGNAWWECRADIAAKGLPGLLQTTYGHYATLGVLPTATERELRNAYLAAVDKGDENKRAAVEAYEILASTIKRGDWESKATGRGSKLAMPWPGNGAGTIRCMVEKRGETWACTEVLGFDRECKESSTLVSWENVHFSESGVSMLLRLGTQVFFGIQDLPFVPTVDMQAEKADFEFPGPTVCERTYRTAKFSYEDLKVILEWEDPVFEVEWGVAGTELRQRVLPSLLTFQEGARGIIFQRLEEEKYLSFKEIQAEALTAGVSVDVLINALWDNGWNLDYVKHIEKFAIDGKWGYSNLGLVFRLPNDLVVLEQPWVNGVTYVFLLCGLSIKELMQALEAMNDLCVVMCRAEKQDELGLCGFARHLESNFDNWKKTVQNVIEEGSDW